MVVMKLCVFIAVNLLLLLSSISVSATDKQLRELERSAVDPVGYLKFLHVQRRAAPDSFDRDWLSRLGILAEMSFEERCVVSELAKPAGIKFFGRRHVALYKPTFFDVWMKDLTLDEFFKDQGSIFEFYFFGSSIQVTKMWGKDYEVAYFFRHNRLFAQSGSVEIKDLFLLGSVLSRAELQFGQWPEDPGPLVEKWLKSRKKIKKVLSALRMKYDSSSPQTYFGVTDASGDEISATLFPPPSLWTSLCRFFLTDDSVIYPD